MSFLKITFSLLKNFEEEFQKLIDNKNNNDEKASNNISNYNNKSSEDIIMRTNDNTKTNQTELVEMIIQIIIQLKKKNYQMIQIQYH